MKFKIRLWLATHLGFYRYGGIWHMSGMPQACVLYPDGNRSAPMAIGNAVAYRNIFGGKIVEP